MHNFHFSEDEKTLLADEGGCKCDLCTAGRMAKRLMQYYMDRGAVVVASNLNCGHNMMLDSMDENGKAHMPEDCQKMQEWIPEISS